MKNLFKSHIYIIFAAVCALLFTSCFDPIFYDINQEVELNSSQIDGDVNSIARFGDYLITQNGYPWYKSASSTTNGEWHKMASIPDGGTVWKIATDADYIYAISKTYEEDTDSSSDYEGELIQKSMHIYCMDTVDGEWEEVDVSSLGDYPVVLFGADSTTEANRHAYFRMYSSSSSLTGKVYELNGTSTPTEVTASTTGLTTSTVAAACYNGTVYFSDYPAITADDTYLYWANTSDTIYYGTSLTATGSKDVDCADILSIAVTGDTLLLGTKSGAYHVSKNTDGSITSEASSSFDTNARSILSSYYYIWVVFSLDPMANEEDGTLYASTTYKGSASASATYWDNQCLWAYYAGRGNWNCE